VRRFFLTWALLSTLWLANTMRTRGVSAQTLQSTATVEVNDRRDVLEFWPRPMNAKTALIFLCGSGVSAHAYAPLLRPIADAGHPVVIVKLPYRFAPFDAHKEEVMDRVREIIHSLRLHGQCVVAGHSLGAALAARVAQYDSDAIAGLVLIGTTHPKEENLSTLSMPVTKVYGTNDGVAPADRVLANQARLPKHTQWIEIRGGNHSQFGHYGHQLLDGKATLTRDEQQALTRTAIMEALEHRQPHAGQRP
jgi:pimeloyl-ACP methyl ester carboxylesterase